MWVYGSGFPKSHNIGKAVDKIEGNEREVVGDNPNHRKTSGLLELGFQDGKESSSITKGNSEWEGWGTALKPAHEPICMARKPLSKKSIAENVLKWGTGGINIDDCRIGSEVRTTPIHSDDVKDDTTMFGLHKTIQHHREETTEGRFPANIMFECICDELIDGKEIKGNENYNWNNTDTQSNTFSNRGTYTPRTETPKIHTNPNCPCYILDEQSGVGKGTERKAKFVNYGNGEYGKKDGRKTQPTPKEIEGTWYGDKGGASRFFYCPKVSKKERDMNMIGEEKPTRKWRDDKGMKLTGSGNPRNETGKNTHPTVKPIKLMEYLIKLVTPKGGVVLEPFMGSGSTGIAAKNLGMSFIGIEREEEYFEIAKQRINGN